MPLVPLFHDTSTGQATTDLVGVVGAARLATTVGESHTYTIVAGSVTTITTALAAILIDNVAPVVGDRVLVKDAPSASGTATVTSASGVGGSSPANGLYVVTAVATQSVTVARAPEMVGVSLPHASSVSVMAGNSYVGTVFQVTVPNSLAAFTYGSSPIGFSKMPSQKNMGAIRRGSLMGMGDSSQVGSSPYDVTNGVDSHAGSNGGHTSGDYMWLGNLLNNSPMDYLGVVATAGLSAQQIKDQLLQTVIAARPQWCFCYTMCENDLLGSGEAPSSVFRTVETSLLALMDAGITPILASALPASNSSTTMSQAEVHRYNAWVTAFARKNGLPFWDFYSVLVDTNSANTSTYGTYKATYAQSDNIHPSGIACSAVLAPIVRDWIASQRNRVAGGALVNPASVAPAWQSGTGAIITGQSANPLLIRTGGTANTPDGCVTSGSPTLALAAPTGVVYPGNEWTITASSSASALANFPSLALAAGDEWELIMRLGATVTTAQTWILYLNDQGNTNRAFFGSGTVSNGLAIGSIPQGTLLYARGKIPAGLGITSLYPQIAVSANGTLKLGQVTLRNLTAMST